MKRINFMALYLCAGLLFTACHHRPTRKNVLRQLTIPGEVEFGYYPERSEKVDSVYLTGDFNGWTTEDTGYRMKKQPDGSFKLVIVLLRERRYAYKYLINGQWVYSMRELERQLSPLPYDYNDKNGDAVIEIRGLGQVAGAQNQLTNNQDDYDEFDEFE